MASTKSVKLSALLGLLSLVLLTQASAKLLWRADFEPNTQIAVPGPEVNTPDNWNANVESPDTKWVLSVYRPNTGRKGIGLKQAGSGCITSGNTPIPSSPTFTDGVIELEMTWADDDSMGVTFRATWGNDRGALGGKDSWGKGYLVVFGYNETVALMLHDMAKGCAEPGHCLNNDPPVAERENDNHCDLDGKRRPIAEVRLDEVGFEVGGVKAGFVDGNRGNMPQDRKHVLYGRIKAIGNKIEIWYLPIDRNFSREKVERMEPMITVRDNTYRSGKVGVWHESWDNGIIDNLIISDEEGFSVDAEDKLATYWGTIKTSK